MYLKEKNSKKTPKRKKSIEKNQLSHTSNAIPQQKIPFCFKNTWYDYREAMLMFSSKLTEKILPHLGTASTLPK